MMTSEQELTMLEITEMILSLQLAVLQAGGVGIHKQMMNWKISELISHLATNKIRFQYIGPVETGTF